MDPGELFGRYEIVRKLGHGGMGEVYLALDTALERRVALKLLAGKSQDDAAARKRLVREAKAAAAIDHPYICKVYDAGEARDQAFIAMEYLEGETLAERLRRGPLAWDEFRPLALETTEALAKAHEQGVAHRDLKPSNIMLTPDRHVKLVDFGLAKRMIGQEDETESALTAPGAVAGTLVYMSPEQFRGMALDGRTDLFSLGIVFFEALAGKHPFERRSGIETAMAMLSAPTPALSAAKGACPPGLDRIVARMMAKEVEERYQSARELLGELRGLEEEREKRQATRDDGPPHSEQGKRQATSNDGPPHSEQGKRQATKHDGPPHLARLTVGREAQREALRRAYSRVSGRRGLLLAVSGEAGIGKTSLVEDFLAELAAAPAPPVITRGRCAEQLAGAEAYLPLLEALDNLLRGAGPAIHGALAALAPTWRVQLGAAGGGGDELSGLHDLPAGSQERLKREMAALFGEISAERPLVVFIEDLHWADISTVDILNFLAARFAEMPVLVLVTYRPAEMAAAQHPFLGISHNLQMRGFFSELSLDFLSLNDVEHYLTLAFPGHAFPPSFAAMIHARTEGNPLFVVDLVRYVHDAGGIREENGRWALSGSLPESPRELPASVRGMIARKIEMLDPEDRRLLVAASVQGDEFDSATLAEAAAMDPADVEERLEAIERVHVFVQRGEEREFPNGAMTLRYRFVHVLYQNVLYASLQPTRRASLSGRVARALVAHHGAEIGSVAGRVALLFETARDFAASAQHYYAAAQNAIGLFAFREALSLAERGLAAVKALPPGPEAKQLELGLQMAKGVALRSTSGWATLELEETFARSRQICRELGDPPATFPVLWAITLFHLIRGNLVECRQRADELMAKAGETGNPAFLMAAHHMAGVSREFLGDMVESTRLLERARELHVASEHAAYVAMYGIDPGMIARAMSGRPLWALGYPDKALERGRETLAIARTQREPLTGCFAMLVLQGTLAYRGDGAEAVELGEECLGICREHGLPQEAEWSRSFAGAGLIALGRVQEGIDLLTDSLEVQARIKTQLARPMYLALLAEGLRQAGRTEDGLKAVEEGLACAERISEGGYVAELLRMRGELYRVAGDASAAEEFLRQALERARRQQAKSFELRAATGLASLLAAHGRASEGRAELLPVYEWFTEGHATRDLTAARALLAEIG
jgi:serine/threonine protein kinase/tetratricopeptide (TPR) repeat protein